MKCRNITRNFYVTRSSDTPAETFDLSKNNNYQIKQMIQKRSLARNGRNDSLEHWITMTKHILDIFEGFLIALFSIFERQINPSGWKHEF